MSGRLGAYWTTTRTSLLMKPQEVGSIEAGPPQITATAALNSEDVFFIVCSLDCEFTPKLKTRQCCPEICYEIPHENFFLNLFLRRN